jgi:hypothetical protein
MNHMVPGIPLNYVTDPQGDDALISCVEYNKKDDSQDIWDPDRPTYTPLYEAIKKQGLLQDPERGFSTSGARRDPDGKPAAVYGFLSPDGSTIHIDDNPENAFARFRTKNGVQLLVHDTSGYVYFISKEGKSWLEVSDEGISFYSKKSINIRSEENINMHCDGSMLSQSGADHSNTGNDTNAARNKREDANKIDRNGNQTQDNGENPESRDPNSPLDTNKQGDKLAGTKAGKDVDAYLASQGVKGGSGDGVWCGRYTQAYLTEHGYDPNAFPANGASAANWKSAGQGVSARDVKPGDVIVMPGSGPSGSHVGVVQSVGPDGIRTIEGNKSNGVGGRNISYNDLNSPKYTLRRIPQK